MAKEYPLPVGLLITQFLAGAFFLVVGAWTLSPMVVDKVELSGRTEEVAGTLAEDPLSCSNGCRVRYEVDGQEVTGQLSVNANLKMRHEGDALDLVYDPVEPQRVALKGDLNLMAIALRAILPFLGIVFLFSALRRGQRLRKRQN
ncbi:DUF3592 domain-containing protein [Streptomyces synnematoformans]